MRVTLPIDAPLRDEHVLDADPPLAPAAGPLGSTTRTLAPRRAQAHAIERPKIPAPRIVISTIAKVSPFRQCRAVPGMV